MDAFDETLENILERAYATKPIMDTLAAAPYNWTWSGESPGSYDGRRQGLEDQIAVLGLARGATALAATQWDLDLDWLIARASEGTRLGKIRYKNDPLKLPLFDLSYPNAGRFARYQQALDFENAWKLADDTWVFEPPTTFANYKAKRLAIVTTAHPNHSVADSAEGHERSKLHVMADDLHAVSVEWYAEATGEFGPDTVPGMLIRTIPTTYDPNRAPGQLRFTSFMSGAPNTMHLAYRAARGEKFYIRGKGPGAAEFAMLLNGVTQTEWLGLGLTAGAWEIEGYATNEHGEGAVSERVTVTVAQAMAA